MEAKSSCATACISPPAVPLYRSKTELTLDAFRQNHQKSLSADVSSQPQDRENTKHQPPGKARRGHSTSNIPTYLPRPKHKDSAPPTPFKSSVLVLNTDLQNQVVNNNPRSPEPELSPTTSQPLSPRKNPQVLCNSESRSRRPPASHSSYGIETSTGPPPSFSTQKSRSQDRMWKPPTPESSDASPTLKQSFFAGDMSAPHDHGDGISPTHITTTSREEFETSDAADQGEEPQFKSKNHTTPPSLSEQGSLEFHNDSGYTKGGINGAATAENNSPSSGEDQQSGKSEDLFLQIAKSEASRPKTSPDSEKRQSQLPSSYAAQRHSERRSDKFLTSPRESTFPPLDVLPSSVPDVSRNTSKRSSLTYRSVAASAHPHDDITRSRYLGGLKSTASSTVGRDVLDMSSGIPQIPGRRFSNADRTYRPSQNHLPRTTRVSAGAEPDRQRFEGTESTVSTAVSNCFDDLNDIKSRLVRLEQARKLPSSSAAAMANERPRTATTTITTMSSSPKHRKKSDSPIQTSIGGIPSTVHPLLHEALAKAKPVVSAEIYQRLEATAADALQLASMLGSGGGSSGVSTIGPATSVERQLRRRGDSMCRGLTELTIALSSESAIQSPQVVRPVSRDVNSPEDTQSTIARVQSRLESRRRSLMAGASLPESPELTSPETAVNNSQTRPSSSRLNRRSLLRYRHEDEQNDGTTDDDRNLSLRPASRAMTELGSTTLVSRSSPRDRAFSREYTSQHPLPNRDRKDNISSHTSNIPSRRTYVSPTPAVTDANNSSPLTPSFQSRSGLRRYGGSVDRAPTVDSSVDSTPDSGGTRLSKPQRRSLGLGSQLSGLGSSVRSRLRAARTERQSAGQGQQDPAEDVGITALPVANHRTVHAR